MNLVYSTTPTFNSLVKSLFDEQDVLPSLFDRSFLPSADILENEKEYEVQLSLPGFDKNDINLKVDDNVLIVTGERKKSDKKFNRTESYFGKFTRRFSLPKDVLINSIEANFKNGILEIKVPKDTNTIKTKLIEIKGAE